MAGRGAACSCGQLRVTAEGDPFVVSICHCLACQRRTGSAFGMQAGFRANQVQVDGRYVDYARRPSDGQDRKVHVFHFCPDCGGTVFCTEPDEDDVVVVMVGAFADPEFPDRRPSRATALGGISGSPFPRASPATRYGLRFSRFTKRASTPRWPTAGETVAEHPEHPTLLYNLACCESLAGRSGDAVQHLRAAIDLREEFRPMAAEDSDFDPIRDQPAFTDLLGEPGATGRAPSATTPSRESTSSTVSGTAASAQPRRS